MEPQPDVVRRRRPDSVRGELAGVLPRDRPAHLPPALHAAHRRREREAVLALRRLRLAQRQGRARRRDRERDRDTDVRRERREGHRCRSHRVGRRDDAPPARRVRARGRRATGGRRAASVRRRELRPRVLVGRDPPLERHGPSAVRARARDAARRPARVDGLPPPLALLLRLPRLPAIPTAGAPLRPPLRRRARRRDARVDRPPLHGRGVAPQARGDRAAQRLDPPLRPGRRASAAPAAPQASDHRADPARGEDPILRRLGHQLGARARKPD